MDSWYTDDLIEGEIQGRLYEYGALRMTEKTLKNLHSVVEFPGVRKLETEIPPDDDALDWNEVKAANPWYFEALKQAAAIMPQRRAKYSGKDPFENFDRMAQIKNTSIAEVFQFYIAEGLARAQVSTGDFEDETFNDRLLDLANYALLWYGYRLKQSSPSRHLA